MFKSGRILAALAVIVLICVPGALAKGNDVRFFGTVLGVTMESSTQGVLRVGLMGQTVSIRLTADTEVEAHGDEVDLDALSIGDFVKISGFFSNSAITAEEIQIIDSGEGEFRLRGPITAVRVVTEGTIITVLGDEVLLDSDTRIEPRGPDGGFTTTNLVTGLAVDVRGESVEGRFVAEHLKVGMRGEAIRVDFGGRITVVETGRLVLDTEGGSTAVVLIGSGTIVVGTPAAGKFADVRGTLNSRLEVVASRIIIKSDRDDDAPPTSSSPLEFRKEIALTPVPVGAAIRGSAEIEIEREDGGIQQEFEVEIRNGLPNTDYRIVVQVAPSTQVDFGTVRTNSEGKAEVEFTNLSTRLPAGKTVRDFVSIQVLQGTTVVLQGTF